MKTKILLPALLGLSCILLMGMISSEPSHAPQENPPFIQFDHHEIVPFPHLICNPCNNETICMDGNVHFRVWGKIYEDGTVQGNEHFNFQGISGSGCGEPTEVCGGDMGGSYNCVSAGNFKFTGFSEEGYPMGYTSQTGMQSLIGQGQAPNVPFQFNVKFIINANGVVTVDFVKFIAGICGA